MKTHGNFSGVFPRCFWMAGPGQLVFRDASRLYESYVKNSSRGSARGGTTLSQLSGMAQPARHARKPRNSGTRNLPDLENRRPSPGEAPSPPNQAARGTVQHVIQLSSDATDALQSTARRLQVTLNALVQGAWALLLNRQSGDAEVVFGAAFSGRPTDLPGVESIVGPFTNNLPVRIRIQPEQTAGDFFRTVPQPLDGAQQLSVHALDGHPASQRSALALPAV